MTQKRARRRAASISSDDESTTPLTSSSPETGDSSSTIPPIDSPTSQAPNNISRREARLAKKAARKSPSPGADPAETSNPVDNATIAAPRKPKAESTEAVPAPLLLTQPTMAHRFPLLIASLGNPEAAYSLTLHSAGHTILNHLRTITPNQLTDWNKSRAYGNAHISQTKPHERRSFLFSPANVETDDWTFWKSPSLMNVSGKAVHTAIKAWRAEPEFPARATEGIVVIVHDELERPFGQIGVKVGGSHKGHNGLKSCNEHLGGVKNKIVRVGVGIGRPVSREPAEVSKWVMRRMTVNERAEMGDAARRVMLALREIELGNLPKSK